MYVRSAFGALLVFLLPATGCDFGPDRELVRQEMVIFASDRGPGGEMNVWMMTPEGEDLRQLTHYGDGYHVPVAISPDGKHILFVHWPDFSDAAGLYMMPVDGPAPELGQSNVVTREYALIMAASYFPDGRRLLVEDAHRLRILDLQDSSLVWLQRDHRISHPDLSPDGRTVCFNQETRTDTLGPPNFVIASQIMLMDIDGTNLRELTPMVRSTYAEHCTFTPDGSKVLYRHTGDIHWTDLTSGERRTYELGDSDHQPVVSPSGERIYFRQRGGMFPEDESEIAVINFDGSEYRRLTNDEHTDGFPIVGVVEFYE